MKRFAILLVAVVAFASLCWGHTVDEVFNLFEDLTSYKSVVTIKGTNIGPEEGTVEISFEETTIIKPVRVVRIKFLKPEELEGQEICITEDKAWVYQPMLEQVIVAPAEKFKFPGMPEEAEFKGPTMLEGNLKDLKKFIEEKTVTTFLGEEDGIWKFKVVPKEKTDKVSFLVVEIDAKGKYPKSLKVFDKDGKLFLDIQIKLIERNKPYDPKKLSAYPEGAEVIEIEEE